MLLIGMVGRVRDCTVTGMLQAVGLAGEWHHSRAHDFFARSRWDPDQLGVLLVDFLVTVFVNAGPIRLAVDDTLFGRSGRKVFGAHYLHDGAQPEGSGRRTRWGTAGLSLCSWSSFRAWVAARSGCLSCSVCSARRTKHVPSSTRSDRRNRSSRER
jgi:hypothetical protein